MAAPRFVHLRLHSEYSIVDGTVRVDEGIAAAVADAMPALAITDLANTFGLVKFYRAARAHGVKPIVGCDVWLTHEAERDQPFRALLLAQSRAGYLRLAEWLTRAYRTNQHRGRAELKRDWLREGSDGLIALSGARDGDVGSSLLQGNARGAAKAAHMWADLFPGRYYLEVQRAGRPDDNALVAATVRLAGELALPVVATHPVQFLRREDYRAHEARVCIAGGFVLADPRRPRTFTPEQYFKTQAEMAAAFADHPEALANSVAIAQRCNVTIPLGKNFLPDFPTPPSVTLDDHLRHEAVAGLERRLAMLYPDTATRDAKRPDYVARLDFETTTIVQMGFAGYFLIVADFINWAKGNGVPVGPGRGSGAGSLVAYALGVTDLDPMRYGLVFERLLNPERVSMPDLDIDFCQSGRDRVIGYVKKKYGAESVSQIATFGTMAAKAAVRDVGRVLDLPYLFCDGIAKLIPFQPGKQVTLREARAMEPLLAEREQKEEEVRELLALAEALEGLTRNVGMHAGGVLIAPGKLTDFCPLYTQAGSDAIVSQFDKDDVEAIGLVKFDFLGLTTLTILDWTLRYVKRLDPASELKLETLPLDDKATYDIFKAANTAAVFQFESRGMRDLVTNAPPTRFEDIIAARRALPARADGAHSDVHGAQDGTRALRISGSAARAHPESDVRRHGVPGTGDADRAGDRRLHARRRRPPAPGDGQEEQGGDGEAPRRVHRRRGEERRVPRQGDHALRPDGEIRRLRLQQVALGRLRAHRLPDGVLQGASSGGVHGGQPVARDGRHRQGARAVRRRRRERPRDPAAGRERVQLPLRARRSRDRSAMASAGSRAPAQQAIEAIVAAREAGGPFRDLFDFCRRVDKRHVNRRAVEALVRSGAFDAVEPHRAMLFASVGVALSEAEKAERSAAQVSLFGDSSEEAGHSLVAAREWTEDERLVHEKAALGFYLSGHPYAAFAQELSPLIRLPLCGPAAQKGAGAHRRYRHRGPRPVLPARQDGDRHPGRRRSVSGGRRLQRDLRRGAHRAARRPARRRRGQDHAAQRRRRTGAGPARSWRTPCTISPRSASATRRACASPATAAPTPHGSRKC